MDRGVQLPVSYPDDDEFLELPPDVDGSRKTTRRQIKFTIIDYQRKNLLQVMVSNSDSRIGKELKREVLILDPYVPHFTEVPDSRQKPREARLPAQRRGLTTGGSPRYSHKNRADIYNFLIKFRQEYLMAAEAYGLLENSR